MDDLVRFVIVGMQRSGTSAISNCVSGHPDVSCPDSEVLIDPFCTRGLSPYLVGGREMFERRRAGHRRLFDSLAAPARPSGEVAYGLKFAIGGYELALDLFIALAEHLPDVRVILVQRDDLVAQFGSLQRARQTGLWHRDRRARPDDRGARRVSASAAEFEAYAFDCLRIRGLLESLAGNRPVLRMSYERDLVPGIDHRKLFDFLGVRSLEPTWLWTGKVSPPVEDFLEGVADLRDVERRVRARDLEDPTPDLLDRISATNQDDDPLFLVTRVHARIERGWPAAAERDLLSLAARAAGLESRVAGQAHAYASHLGMDAATLVALAAGRDEDGTFRAHRAMTVALAGRDEESVEELARAMTVDPRAAAPWWIEVLTASIARLDGEGRMDAALAAVRSACSLAATAIVDCVVARQRGDSSGGDPHLVAARTAAPELVAALELEPAGSGPGPG